MTSRVLTLEEAGLYARGLFEFDFWQAQASAMQKQHPDEWVAVVDEKVVASARNLSDLVDTLVALGIDLESAHASFVETKFGHWLL
jgi:hypothetical protein